MFEPYDIERELEKERALQHLKSRTVKQEVTLIYEADTNRNEVSVILDRDASDKANEELIEDIKISLYRYGLKSGKYYDSVI